MKPTKNTLDPERLPLLLTTKQVADILGYNTVTIRKWAANGIIKAQKVGPKIWKIPRDEVKKYL